MPEAENKTGGWNSALKRSLCLCTISLGVSCHMSALPHLLEECVGRVRKKAELVYFFLA